MNRCLHITIHEAGKSEPESYSPTLGMSSTDSTDPNSNIVEPPPDGRYYVPVTSPSVEGSGGGSGAVQPATSAACGATVEIGCCCGCAPKASTTGASQGSATIPGLRPGDYSGFVIVRLAEGVLGDIPAENLWTLGEVHEPKLRGLQAVFELSLTTPVSREAQAQPAPGPGGRQSVKTDFPAPISLPPPPAGVLVSRPLVELKERKETKDIKEKALATLLSRSESLALLRGLEKKAATTSLRPLHSLTAYWRIDLRDRPDLIDDVVARLNRLAEVDLAYRELSANDAQLNGTATGKVLEEDQGYLDDAPGGISAAWAWQTLANSGHPMVKVCDLEQGWNSHNDLQKWLGTAIQPIEPFVGGNRADEGSGFGNHGTAVLGQLAAAGGVKGAAADVASFLRASHYRKKDGTDPFPGTNGHVAAAIVQALTLSGGVAPIVGPLGAGDVLLLEVQRGLLPTEIDDADFDAIRLASALQVIVVEAAGNGGFDLDSYTGSDGGRVLRRGDPGFRDSGAILVGAARAAVPHDRASFSNYGSRVDCFGWGEAVTTCGFGDLAGTTLADFYTNRFNGTSSASPIIAGAAALVQALYQNQKPLGNPPPRLGPQEMRSILSDPATGTRQGPNVAGFIGIMPDLRAIVRGQLQLVPDVYLRRSIGDDGSAPGLADEISSSPDVLIATGGLTVVSGQFGEGSLRANLPAPGDPVKMASNDLYVRLRNRGLGLGAVRAQLFASPAATLITPERWIPVGNAPLDVGVLMNQVLQGVVPSGDTLFLAGPVAWTPPIPMTDSWSFLAILTPPESGSVPSPFVNWGFGLPPAGPYFDWAEYRAFLRRHGVAWRNAHRVPTPAANQALKFLIAGTPDQTRHFDLEVIQRLPAGVTVTLDLPTAPALAAKLRQNQPWLGVSSSSTSIALPPRPRTTFKRVALPAGTNAQATFTLSGTPLPTSGHSLALRQLWKGEEVGRITWFFGPA